MARVDLFSLMNLRCELIFSLAEFSIAGMLPALLQDGHQAEHTVGPALLAQMEEYARPACVYTPFARQMCRSRIFS